MIKIKTKYNNETDQFVWNYECEHSHTMEHLAVIQSLFDLIIKNDPDYKSYRDVYKEVKKVKSNMINREELEDE